ncbi:unnamed protein product, partial [Gulo gulo]
IAPTKKGGEKKNCSAIKEVETREYTISIHKGIHGVGFKKLTPLALEDIWKFAMKEMETPNVYHQAQQSCLGQRNKECSVWYLCAVAQKM